MTIKITRIISFAEYVAMQDAAVTKGWYRNDQRMFVPGTAWSQPFHFDPLGELAAFVDAHPGQGYRREAMIKDSAAGNASFLSPHYWRDWSTKRAPICVVCPNGEEWEIDRKSSNGDGWIVTGELPNITCAPSIVAGNYHGYLRDGVFTDDLEQRTYPTF